MKKLTIGLACVGVLLGISNLFIKSTKLMIASAILIAASLIGAFADERKRKKEN